MQKDQWPVEVIHGDKSQNERDFVLNAFKRGTRPILIATDVAARGLDVKDVVNIINYDFPNNVEDYVHRIGRTARGSDNTGTAYTFFTFNDSGSAKELISLLKDSEQQVPNELYEMIPRKAPGPNKFRRYGGGGRNGG